MTWAVNVTYTYYKSEAVRRTTVDKRTYTAEGEDAARDLASELQYDGPDYKVETEVVTL